jgi:hypothetical protein
MKKLLLIAIMLLPSCTMYSVEKVMPDGSSTKVYIKSTRSFEQPNLHYARQGTDATFDFQAANADNNTAAIVGMLSPMVQMLQMLIQANTVVPPQ